MLSNWFLVIITFARNSGKVFLEGLNIGIKRDVTGMQEYEIKRGHYANIEGEKLGSILTEIFGTANKLDDASFESTFGAIAKITVHIKDKKAISVDTVMNSKVDANTAADTVKRYNVFLERATGLTSKERVKRLNKKAKDGKL